MIFEDLLIFTAAVGGVLSLLTIGGSNLYDLRHIDIQKQFEREPNARRYRPRPLMTVIIPTLNDERLIEQTLASVARSNYRKLEIIVVDRNSTDSTCRIVRQFITDHPAKSIKLSAKRRAVTLHKAVSDVYHSYAKGKLIMRLQPGQSLDRQALIGAVRHFNAEPGLGGLTCSRRLNAAHSAADLFQHFEMMLSYRSQKFNSVSNTDYAAATVGVIYNREVFNDLLKVTSSPMIKLGNRETRLCYGNDVVVYDVPMSSFRGLLKQRYQLQLHRVQLLKSCRKLFFSRDKSYSRFLTWFRLPFAVLVGLMALCLPVVLMYFIYLVLRFHQPALYVLSWALITFYTISAVWGNEQLKWRQRISYTILSPITQGAVYILSFVQLFAVTRALFGQGSRET